MVNFTLRPFTPWGRAPPPFALNRKLGRLIGKGTIFLYVNNIAFPGDKTLIQQGIAIPGAKNACKAYVNTTLTLEDTRHAQQNMKGTVVTGTHQQGVENFFCRWATTVIVGWFAGCTSKSHNKG
jgi:hypothetical protein